MERVRLLQKMVSLVEMKLNLRGSIHNGHYVVILQFFVSGLLFVCNNAAQRLEIFQTKIEGLSRHPGCKSTDSSIFRGRLPSNVCRISYGVNSKWHQLARITDNQLRTVILYYRGKTYASRMLKQLTLPV